MSSASRPSPSRRPTTPGSLHARSADEVIEISSYLDSEEHIRAAKQTGATRSTPATAFSPRTRVVRGGRRRRRADLGRAARGGVTAREETSSRPSGSRARPAFRRFPRDRPRRSASLWSSRPSAGGGGRGMRVVRDPGELGRRPRGRRARGASRAFGDGTLYLERYLERPRHIEVQLLADAHGTVVALGERDCSVQRRHQKVLEEAPAPRLDASCATRCWRPPWRSAARSATESAGTVEFVVDGRRVLLPRAQRADPGRAPGDRSRHRPRSDRRAAPRSRRRIALQQTVTRSDGHAVEVRLYAEDPRTFLPQTGRVERLSIARPEFGSTQASTRVTRSGSPTTR